MKLRLLAATLAALTLVAGSAFAQTTPPPNKNDLSYALGYQLGRNLIESGEPIDTAIVIKALQEGYAKKDPSVPVAQLEAAMTAMQKREIEKNKALFEKASAENKTKSDQFLAANKAKVGVKVLPSGVQYRVIEVGSGAKPTQANTVSLQYKGALSDGRTFVDTFAPVQGQTTPPAPMEIKVSEIPLAGLRDALQQMPSGSRWELAIPADKAYGNTPQSPIGPNQAVVFEVKLVGVK